jgi:probable selenium-dependent hydroxylase accessory protein YqeC
VKTASLVSALLLSGGGVVSLVGAGGKTTLMFALAKALGASGASVLATTTTKVRVPASADVPCIIVSSRMEDVLKRARAPRGRESVFFAAAGEIPEKKKLAGFTAGRIDDLAASGAFEWIIVEADGAAQRPLKAPGPLEPVIPSASGWVVGVCGLDALGRPLNDAGVFRPDRFARISGAKMGMPVTAVCLARGVVHPEGMFKGRPKDAMAVVFLNKADTRRAVTRGREVAAAVKQMKSPLLHRLVIGHLSPVPEILEIHQM